MLISERVKSVSFWVLQQPKSSESIVLELVLAGAIVIVLFQLFVDALDGCHVSVVPQVTSDFTNAQCFGSDALVQRPRLDKKSPTLPTSVRSRITDELVVLLSQAHL